MPEFLVKKVKSWTKDIDGKGDARDRSSLLSAIALRACRRGPLNQLRL